MRIKLTLQFKGTHYYGWQRQPHHLSIQEVLEETISKITKEKTIIVGCSRTDTGVHALNYVCHFDWKGDLPQSIQEDHFKLLLGIQSYLPDDIGIKNIELVDKNFHAQKKVISKEYHYYVLPSKIRNPFLQEYTWRIPYSLDLEKLQQAVAYLVGYQNFQAFCASDSNVKTYHRNLFELKISTLNANELFIPYLKNEKILQFKFVGDGFLKQMIRNIMGTLIIIGRKKENPKWIEEVIKSKDRKKAGACAPAKGLILYQVNYESI